MLRTNFHEGNYRGPAPRSAPPRPRPGGAAPRAVAQRLRWLLSPSQARSWRRLHPEDVNPSLRCPLPPEPVRKGRAHRASSLGTRLPPCATPRQQAVMQTGLLRPKPASILRCLGPLSPRGMPQPPTQSLCQPLSPHTGLGFPHQRLQHHVPLHSG